MKRSVQAISSSPWAGERERSTLSSLAAAISGSLSRSLSSSMRIEQALAHAERGDHHVLRLGDAHEIFEHQRRVGQQRPAGIGDHLDPRQRLGIDPVHQAGKLVGLLGRDDVAVHDVQRIAVLPHVQPGERAPGAADGVEAAALALVQQVRLLERLLDDLFRLLDGFRRDVLQREPAERERHAAFGAMAVDFGEFERAAAEIADDAVGLWKPETTPSAASSASRLPDSTSTSTPQMRSASATKDLPFLASRQAAVAIARTCPTSMRSHSARKRRMRRERLLDRVGGEQAGRLHLAAETGQHLLVEDRRRAAGQPLIDDEAHRVRADVDDRDRRPVIETTLRHVDCQPPPFNRGRGGV